MAPHSFGKPCPQASPNIIPGFRTVIKLFSHSSIGGNVSISRADIEKVAVLARIKVDSEQVSALEKDLGNILDLVDQLSAADTESVEPMAHPLDAVQKHGNFLNVRAGNADVA